MFYSSNSARTSGCKASPMACRMRGLHAPPALMKVENLIRPLVRDLHPYVPGEQPKLRGLIKLNTNENPYPPSPKVLRAVKSAVDERLRLYPNPTSSLL